MKSICLAGIFIFLFSSCMVVKKVPKSYLELVPYKINDVLVFRDNRSKQLDTFVITKVREPRIEIMEIEFHKNLERYYLIFKVENNVLVGCHDDIKDISGLKESCSNIVIEKDYYGHVMGLRTSFNFFNKYLAQALFEGLVPKLDSLKLMPVTTESINDKAYNDVVKIITKENGVIYWSLSKGYIKFEYEDLLSFELVKHYNSKRFCGKVIVNSSVRRRSP